MDPLRSFLTSPSSSRQVFSRLPSLSLIHSFYLSFVFFYYRLSFWPALPVSLARCPYMKWKSNIRNRIALCLAMVCGGCVCLCVSVFMHLFVWQVHFTLVCPTFHCTQCAVCLLRDLTAPNIFIFAKKLFPMHIHSIFVFMLVAFGCCCCFLLFSFRFVFFFSLFISCSLQFRLVLCMAACCSLPLCCPCILSLYRFVHRFILVNFVNFGTECVSFNFL